MNSTVTAFFVIAAFVHFVGFVLGTWFGVRQARRRFHLERYRLVSEIDRMRNGGNRRVYLYAPDDGSEVDLVEYKRRIQYPLDGPFRVMPKP